MILQLKIRCRKRSARLGLMLRSSNTKSDMVQCIGLHSNNPRPSAKPADIPRDKGGKPLQVLITRVHPRSTGDPWNLVEGTDTCGSRHSSASIRETRVHPRSASDLWALVEGANTCGSHQR